MPRLIQIPVTIANGKTESAITSLANFGRDPNLLALVGLIIPATITSTAITIKSATLDGATALPIYDEFGSQVGASIAIAASRHIMLDPSSYCGLEHIQLVTGSAEGADRVITVLARAV